MDEDKKLEIKTLIEENYSSWGDSFNAMSIMEAYIEDSNEHYPVESIYSIYLEVKAAQPVPEPSTDMI